MLKVLYRQARLSDIRAMAEIRANDWGTEEYWRERIHQYLTHELHPMEALRPRVSFIGLEREHIVGLIEGHLSVRGRSATIVPTATLVSNLPVDPVYGMG